MQYVFYIHVRVRESEYMYTDGYRCGDAQTSTASESFRRDVCCQRRAFFEREGDSRVRDATKAPGFPCAFGGNIHGKCRETRRDRDCGLFAPPRIIPRDFSVR